MRWDNTVKLGLMARTAEADPALVDSFRLLVPNVPASAFPQALNFNAGDDNFRGRGSSSHGALEGYLALRVVIEALRACERNLDRRCVLQALGGRSFELPGMKVQFGPAQRQSRPFVEINMIGADGRLRH